MKQFLITVAGVLVGSILFLIAGLGLIMFLASQKQPLPDETVLVIDLRGGLTDQPSGGFNPFGGGSPAVLDIVAKLDAAAREPKIKGVFLRVSHAGFSAAHAEELRDAIAAFRQSEKFVVAHLQGEGLRQSMASYAAVAGASELWIQAAGELAPMGIVAEGEFLGETFRRFSVVAEFEQREGYKNAPNTFTEAGFTPQHREATESLINGVYDNLIGAIAASRGLTPVQVREALAATPMTAQDAMNRRLFDRIGQPEEAERRAREQAGEDANLLDIADYAPELASKGPVIAVIGGQGAVMVGSEGGGLFGDTDVMSSDEIAAALVRAADDEGLAERDHVRAIVFRVSSPGGSLSASDQIEAAVRYARSRGKPVVVSMGDVAASGGYWVSAQADEIIAQPSTITGSIGVFGGKVAIGGALDRFASVRSETVTVGSPVVDMYSGYRGFAPNERAALAASIDRGYQTFLARVAEGRRLSVEETRAVAQGRVWTGVQAKERRLVDALGGYATALARARALAQIGADEPVRIRRFPEQRSPLDQLRRALGVSAEAAQTMAALHALVGEERMRAAMAAVRAQQAPIRAEAPPLRIE